MTVDVAIVGGGVAGWACAHYLRRHGFTGRVAIIEKDTSHAYSCTARSVGGLRQQFSTPENIELSKFGLALIRNLKDEFGAEAYVSFREQGYLFLASDAGAGILAENHAVQIAHGADNILLDPGALVKRFPWLVPDGIAMGCFGVSGEGWLDPHSLMTLFRKAAMAKGAELIASEAIGIAASSGRVTAIDLANGERLSCGILVNAAGAGAGAVAALAGIDLPVGPRKRYVYAIDCPQADESMQRGPLMVDTSGCYLRPEGRLFICGLSPDEADEPAALDWEVDYSWFEERIWPALAARIPVLETLKVVNAWVGHYDYNALDQNAVIGPHPAIANFLFANGFSGHGLQQSPAAGNAIAELIVHGEFRAIDLKRFGYERIAKRAPLFERNVI
jgi:FAD-dependent oxidoreductase domain-containing protein 1